MNVKEEMENEQVDELKKECEDTFHCCIVRRSMSMFYRHSPFYWLTSHASNWEVIVVSHIEIMNHWEHHLSFPSLPNPFKIQTQSKIFIQCDNVWIKKKNYFDFFQNQRTCQWYTNHLQSPVLLDTKKRKLWKRLQKDLWVECHTLSTFVSLLNIHSKLYVLFWKEFEMSQKRQCEMIDLTSVVPEKRSDKSPVTLTREEHRLRWVRYRSISSSLAWVKSGRVVKFKEVAISSQNQKKQNHQQIQYLKQFGFLFIYFFNWSIHSNIQCFSVIFFFFTSFCLL